MHVCSSRVTCNKKGGNQHKIPYSIGFLYQHPPVDNVPPEFRVDTREEDGVDFKESETVEAAIEVYMQAFCKKFQSKWGRDRRRKSLQHFQKYLVLQRHSLKLKDLTSNDGQGFIDSLVNQYNGSSLGAGGIKRYRSAIRSFSRFLYEAGIITENVFLMVENR